jgi:hypothetical protein
VYWYLLDINIPPLSKNKESVEDESNQLAETNQHTTAKYHYMCLSFDFTLPRSTDVKVAYPISFGDMKRV